MTSPTVYFTGTGTLLLFSLGVAKYLKEHYTWDDSRVLTVSGGGIPAVALLTLPPTQFDVVARRIAEQFSQPTGGLGRLLKAGEYYQTALKYVVQKDTIHFLRDKLLIKTTQVPCIKHLVYNGPYNTVDEVVGKLSASAYIPVVFFMRLPWPDHLLEVDGAFGISNWIKEPWEDTLVVGPSYSGNEDVWYQPNDWLRKIRPLSYFEHMSLYYAGYKKAQEQYEVIELKLGERRKRTE